MASVLITGAAKRIGRSLSLFLASQGFDIALHYNRSKNEAQSLCAEIQQLGVKCELFQADLTDFDRLEVFLESVVSKMQDLEVIIHNASNFYPLSFKETKLEDWKSLFDIHVKSSYFLSQKYVSLCEKGHLIFFTDADPGFNASSDFVYTLSKKSLTILIEMLAKELGPDFRVNGIAPGWIIDAVGDVQLDETALLSQIPLQRQGALQDIQQAVNFLLKEYYITGQILYVDGGRHCG